MRISIVGTGYVGLVAAVCFAETGNDVIALDVDSKKIERLSRGEVPIYEPGLFDIFIRSLNEGRLKFTTSYATAVKHAEVIFLSLPTPATEDGTADNRYVLSAVREIAAHMDNYKIIVSKSTVPVGTHKLIENEIRKLNNGDFAVVSNPEFLKEGSAVDDFLRPNRVVIGTTDDRAWEAMRNLYEPFVRTGAPVLRMSPASAELAKYAANGFLATKISFMNEIALLCERTGADIESVRLAMSKDARIGNAFLFAGIGFGGSCFPKDTRALIQSGKETGLNMEVVRAAITVNERQKLVLFPKILNHFGGSVEGRTIAVWGLAFKPRTDDIREAPAIALIEKLVSARAKVQVYDPVAASKAREALGNRVVYSESAYDAVTDADALVLTTEWNEFRMPDWPRIKRKMRCAVVFDGRNIFRPQDLQEQGFNYFGIGRPA